MAQKRGKAQKRGIFEEVSDETLPPRAALAGGGRGGGLIDGRPKGARGAIRRWLIALFVLVLAMILVGGLTRLTDSGLSITEWKPVTGLIPPLSEADWAAEFEKYKSTPEFALQNSQILLDEFKSIYWWEWAHRSLGRLVGLVWAVGFLWFLARRAIPPGWTLRLLGLGLLGGLQGAVGWWMVSSGLTGAAVDVASSRLAVHLGLGFAILGLLAVYAMKLGRSEAELMTARRGREARPARAATAMMHLAFLQILLGALVAGIDAGRAFPTWPLMGDGLLPPDPFQLTPLWRNFLEDAGLVQFLHRTAGYLLVLVGILAWLRGRKSAHGQTRFAFHMVLLMLLAQLGLGIMAVLTSAQLHVAITHQLGAVVLWVLILRARHLAQYPVAGSIREGTA